MARPAGTTATQIFVKIAIPLLSRWVRTSPQARDARVIHRSGPDPLRLLLIGDGNAVGYGVLSHEVGLGGAIAGRVAGATGRGVELEIVADDRMSAASCLERLGEIDLSRFDGVILNIGLNDALRVTSEAAWRADARHLLRFLEATEVPMFVVAIPQASEDGAAPSSIRAWIRDRAELFNTVLEGEVSRTADGIFVPLESLVGRRYTGKPTRDYYEEIAAQVAPTVAAVVADATRPHFGQDELERLDSLKAIHILDSAPEERFDRIVVAVRQSFAVPTAAITFIDRDRQWTKATTAVDRSDVPRSGAICATTIQTEGLLVVEDTREDPRFADYPGVAADGGVRFYAGYPLETQDGFRVGALCIMDRRPHEFSDQDGIVLRDFALEAQRQLWAS